VNRNLTHLKTIPHIILVALLVIAALATGCSPQPTVVEVTATPSPTPPPTPTPIPTSTTEDVRVLALVSNLYGANTHLILDNFELFGWDVTLTGVTESVRPCRQFAVQHGSGALTVDVLVSEVEDVAEYDVLALMPVSREGGREVENNQDVIDLITAANEEGLVLYALCRTGQALEAAGLAQNLQVPADARPTIGGNVVLTKRGLYNTVPNCNAVGIALEGLDRAVDINHALDTQSATAPVDDVAWSRTLGGPAAEGGHAIQATSDGGFIVAGYTHSFGEGYADVYLVKTDAEGTPVWSNTFGGRGWDVAFSVDQTEDGGYVIAGYTTSFGAGSRDVYLVRTDGEGNELWSQTFGGSGVDMGRSVVEAENGDIVVAGTTESSGAGLDDVLLIRTDSEGDEIWTRTFGGDASDMGEAVVETRGGDLVVVGATGSHSSNRDVYLVRTDGEGNEVWTQAIGFPGHLGYDWGNAVRETRDGGLIVAGNSDTSDQGQETLNAILLKTDADGNQEWVSSIGETIFYDYGTDVVETGDGGYLLVGSSKTIRGTDNAVYVARTDAQGEVLWTRMLGGEGFNWASAVCQAQDGSYAVVGQTNAYGAGAFDVFLTQIAE
jgi:hypothetical protein